MPKDGHMTAYLEEVRKLEKHFKGMELSHVPRKENQEADDIARRVSRREAQRVGVFEERLTRASMKQPKEATDMDIDEELPLARTSGAPNYGPPSGDRLLLAMTHQETGWIDEIKEYLRDGVLPEEDAEAERIARQAKSYCLHEGDLYRSEERRVGKECRL